MCTSCGFHRGDRASTLKVTWMKILCKSEVVELNSQVGEGAHPEVFFFQPLPEDIYIWFTTEHSNVLERYGKVFVYPSSLNSNSLDNPKKYKPILRQSKIE